MQKLTKGLNFEFTANMPPTDEDLAWFRSTFHPIPKPALPNDCVEYSLYVLDPDLDSNVDSETRLRLRDVQRYASSLQMTYLKDYIWQRQDFSLELVKEDGEVCILYEQDSGEQTNK